MTVITRTARNYFSQREPGAPRIWLRLNSSTWRHFDPMAKVIEACGFCGQRAVFADHATTGTFEFSIPKHNIGFVNIAGVRHDKFCDGTEEAP